VEWHGAGQGLGEAASAACDIARGLGEYAEGGCGKRVGGVNGQG
jgi:hypothetical protein